MSSECCAIFQILFMSNLTKQLNKKDLYHLIVSYILPFDGMIIWQCYLMLWLAKMIADGI